MAGWSLLKPDPTTLTGPGLLSGWKTAWWVGVRRMVAEAWQGQCGRRQQLKGALRGEPGMHISDQTCIQDNPAQSAIHTKNYLPLLSEPKITWRLPPQKYWRPHKSSTSTTVDSPSLIFTPSHQNFNQALCYFIYNVKHSGTNPLFLKERPEDACNRFTVQKVIKNVMWTKSKSWICSNRFVTCSQSPTASDAACLYLLLHHITLQL